MAVKYYYAWTHKLVALYVDMAIGEQSILKIVNVTKQ